VEYIKQLFVWAIPLNLRTGLYSQINTIHPLVAARAPVVEPPTVCSDLSLGIFHLHCVALFGAHEAASGRGDPLVGLAAVLQRGALEGVPRVEGPHLGKLDNDWVAKIVFNVLHFVLAPGLGEDGLARADSRRGVSIVVQLAADISPPVTFQNRVAVRAFDSLECQPVFIAPGEIVERGFWSTLDHLFAYWFFFGGVLVAALPFEFFLAIRKYQVQSIHALVASAAPVMDPPVLGLHLAFGIISKKHFSYFRTN